MAGKSKITPLMPQPDGSYLVVFEDGSWAKYDGMAQQIGGDDSPNPLRAASFRTDQNPALEQLKKDASTEDARRFDADLQSKKDQIDNTYKVGMMNARTNAEQNQLTAQYNQSQIDLAKQKLQFDQQTSERDFGQRQTEFNANLGQRQSEFDRNFGQHQTEFNTNTGLAQAGLGQQYLSTAASLRGPSNYFQSSDYMRGVAGAPDTSTFLSALQNNTRLRDYGAQGGLPAPETMDTLTAKLGGVGQGAARPGGMNSVGNGVADNNGNYLAQVGNIAAKGAHQLAPGSLESLNPSEMGLFTSGLDKLGVDSSGFLDSYRRSRIGQGVGASRAA